MEYCVQQLGVQEIKFYDDTFTMDRQRVIDICNLIIKRKLKVNWDIRRDEKEDVGRDPA